MLNPYPAKKFVKKSRRSSTATPVQAGAHHAVARTPQLGHALQLLEEPGVAEPWVPAFAGKTGIVCGLSRLSFDFFTSSWVGKIQRLRIKPDCRTGSVKFYYDLLFEFPFGGVEVANIRTIMHLISEEYDGVISEEYDGVQPTKTAEERLLGSQPFIARVAQLHAGAPVLDMVPE